MRQKLFDYISQEFNHEPLVTEMQEIENIVKSELPTMEQCIAKLKEINKTNETVLFHIWESDLIEFIKYIQGNES